LTHAVPEIANVLACYDSASLNAMHLPLLKIALIILASAVCAALTMFRYAFTTGESPSDDGPRALIVEFLGWCICFACLIWSFTIDGKTLQWTLRGVAALAAFAGVGLSVYFSGSTEVPEKPDKEPTGFKNKSTDLHLE
jgi:hypothetical protein